MWSLKINLSCRTSSLPLNEMRRVLKQTHNSHFIRFHVMIMFTSCHSLTHTYPHGAARCSPYCTTVCCRCSVFMAHRRIVLACGLLRKAGNCISLHPLTSVVITFAITSPARFNHQHTKPCFTDNERRVLFVWRSAE